jgi:Stc1 domain
MKICTKCGVEKPLDAFGKLARGSQGRNAQCKDCRNNYRAARYAQREDKTYQWLDKRELAVADKLRVKCLDCQQQPEVSKVLDFVRRSDGTINVPRMLRTWGVPLEDVLAEIAACDVVCKNCQTVRKYSEQERAQKLRWAKR